VLALSGSLHGREPPAVRAHANKFSVQPPGRLGLAVEPLLRCLPIISVSRIFSQRTSLIELFCEDFPNTSWVACRRLFRFQVLQAQPDIYYNIELLKITSIAGAFPV